MRIIKLIPYYGRWPDFMHLYLDSCRRNPMIEVTFVTDLPPFPDSPPNVRYVPVSLQAFRERIKEVLSMDARQLQPYKLCDFRPAFGVLLSDIIGEADFWGYGDNDMVLGRLPRFLTPERLARHDVLSFKRGHLQGPLTIYRNNRAVNNLFRDGGHFRHVFTHPGYLHFDEFGPDVFHKRITLPDQVSDLPSDNISVIAFKRALAGDLAVYCEQHGKEDLKRGETLVFDDGRISDSRTGQEHMFYHWVLEKRATWFKYPRWAVRRPHRYYVSTTGFYSTEQYPYFKLLHSWRLARGTTEWAVLKGANYIRRRLGLPVTVDTYPRIGWVKKIGRPG